jgi:hypothetical protein
MIHPHASPSATASTRPNLTRHGTGESVVPFGGGSYEIRLAGRLSDSVLAAFECEASGLTVSVEPAAMVLYGPVPDQAALGGLVDRILSSGLEVVEVRRLPSHPMSLG